MQPMTLTQQYAAAKAWMTNEIQCRREDMARFEINIAENLQALAQYHPGLCADLFKAPPDRALQIEPVGQDNASNEMIYSIRDLRHHHQAYSTKPFDFQQVVEQTLNGLVIIGLGSNRQVLSIFKDSAHINDLPNYQIGLFIVETSYSMLKASLLMNNLVDLLTSDRVFWFIGPEKALDLEKIIATEHQLEPAVINVDNLIAAEMQPRLLHILTEGNAQTARLRQELQAIYNARTDDEWHAIFNDRKRPIRVLGITSLFTSYLRFCMQDILGGFKRMGCEIQLSIEKEPFCRVTDSYFQHLLESFMPDLLIGISFNRCNFTIGIPENIPFVSWQQDLLPHCRSEETARQIKKKDFIIAAPYNRSSLLEHQYEEEKVQLLEYWPTDTHTYKPVRLSTSECKKYGSDLFFVSHHSGTPEAALRRLLEHFPPQGNDIGKKVVTEFFERIQSRYMAWKDYPISENQHKILFNQLLEEKSVWLPPDSINFIAHFFFMYISNLFLRQLPLERLAEQGIDIALYGRKWEDHPRLGRFARGIAQNGPELNLIYNASRITYHALHAKTMHTRYMDASAAKSFFMIKRLDEIPFPARHPVEELFTPGKDFIYFDGPDDIVDKVVYYLSHPDERQQIAESAYQKVQSFSYTEFARSILDLVAQNPNNIVAHTGSL